MPEAPFELQRELNEAILEMRANKTDDARRRLLRAAKKVPGNPAPDEVVKIIEEKYGAPARRKITNTLDLIAYWYPDGGRYEIFFHNISSWDNFDVQYTDTVLQKQKDQRDKEMNRKPVKKELDF